ncbi:MAG: DEAD/DEAH box helicase family protein, partial [Zoogloea sp.]|nr:DEAD/DEAH box helicase family protein [Zoogloea sp.]
MPSSSSAERASPKSATGQAATQAGPRGWPGVGPQLAGRLAKLDIYGPADLILHLPLRYEDETRLSRIADAPAGVPVQLEVEVVSSEVTLRPRRQLVARVQDDSGSITLRFLNFYPQQQKQLAPGARLRVFGELRGGFFGDEMIHPRLHPVAPDEPLPDSLTPVYPTTAGLTQPTLRKLIGKALDRLPADSPPEPADALAGIGLQAALRLLHQPPPAEDAELLADREHPAWRRIKLDELVAQQISLRRAHAARRAKTASMLPIRHQLTDALRAALPFSLTGAQERAVAEIARDLASPHPMQRLLQGDVGSGKTIVAALAMLQAAENGRQSVLMAPTEILAE